MSAGTGFFRLTAVRMRNAPSVSFPVGRSRFEGGLLLALGVSGGAALGFWMAQALVPPLWAAGALALWLAGALLAWRRWRATPAGRLQWREGGWFFAGTDVAPAADPAPLPRAPRVALDLQQRMLLEVPGFSPRWCWVARRDEPASWNALRRAVHARPLRGESQPSASGLEVRP